MGELVSHMIGEEEFYIDLFNSMMRRLNQKNQRCTFTSKSICNRHYFKAEFLVNVPFRLKNYKQNCENYIYFFWLNYTPPELEMCINLSWKVILNRRPLHQGRTGWVPPQQPHPAVQHGELPKNL
jgi:hypothetical protein